MTWLEHHKISEHHAQLAEVALVEQGLQTAQKHYLEAAEAELLALAALEPGKLRTMGITVVSAVALMLKADCLRRAEQIACEWMATDELPLFAVQELRQMLVEIWQKQPMVIAVS